ncbi:hypothetical protein C8R46DRAFT_1080696 [Mycena filopes]|nr:hypothetical protein C8R46DRAFT_1080696 [Mycena filopes]
MTTTSRTRKLIMRSSTISITTRTSRSWWRMSTGTKTYTRPRASTTSTARSWPCSASGSDARFGPQARIWMGVVVPVDAHQVRSTGAHPAARRRNHSRKSCIPRPRYRQRNATSRRRSGPVRSRAMRVAKTCPCPRPKTVTLRLTLTLTLSTIAIAIDRA